MRGRFSEASLWSSITWSCMLHVLHKATRQLTAWSTALSVLLSQHMFQTHKSKSWHFHSSRYKSLNRSWILVVSSLSVAPKAIWNMSPVAAMWVTEGWTQHLTLEYLCSYDHQKTAFGKRRKCSLFSLCSPFCNRRWTSESSQSAQLDTETCVLTISSLKDQGAFIQRSTALMC